MSQQTATLAHGPVDVAVVTVHIAGRPVGGTQRCFDCGTLLQDLRCADHLRRADHPGATRGESWWPADLRIGVFGTVGYVLDPIHRPLLADERDCDPIPRAGRW